MSRRRVRNLSAGLVSAAVASCTGAAPLAETPTIDGADDQVATCKVAKDPLNPMVIEWPGTSKVDLDAASQRNVVVVSYRGCTLKVLNGCTAAGRYDFIDTTPTRDQLVIGTTTDLYARLPLGAASLKGELDAGSSLKLDYIAVGQKVAAPPVSIGGECEGATHFVRSIIVGAYSLDAQATTGVGVEAGVGSAGAGARRQEEVRRLRSAGDVTKCERSGKKAADCGAVLQLGLLPLPSFDSAGVAAAPASGGDGGAADRRAPSRTPTGNAELERATKAAALVDVVSQKQKADDGPGCLATLDEMKKLDANLEASLPSRWMCELLAGKCAQGKARMLDFYAKHPDLGGESPDKVPTLLRSYSNGKCQ
jgi:hypothetical protein